MLPRKLMGLSGALLKSVILALVGITVQFVIFLIKRGKSRKLDLIKKQEEEEYRERERVMEEQWRLSEEEEKNRTPEFMISVDNSHLLKEPISVSLVEDDLGMFGGQAGASNEAYDGELNAMTFNLVKGSKAFDVNT